MHSTTNMRMTSLGETCTSWGTAPPPLPLPSPTPPLSAPPLYLFLVEVAPPVRIADTQSCLVLVLASSLPLARYIELTPPPHLSFLSPNRGLPMFPLLRKKGEPGCGSLLSSSSSSSTTSSSSCRDNTGARLCCCLRASTAAPS